MANEQPEGSPPRESLEKPKKINLEEARKSLEEIQILSERGWAIMVASHLDEQLAALLRAFFVDDQKTVDQLLEDTGAIAGFGVRIELAFLLGLISARERRMLNLIRKIRNDFAHNSKSASFSQSPIKDWCLELDARQTVESEKLSQHSEPVRKFIAAFSFLLLVLVDRREHLRRCDEAESISEDHIASIIKECEGESK